MGLTRGYKSSHIIFFFPSVGLLLVVIFYFFAIIGMEAFGSNEDKSVFKGCCNDSWYEVGQYYQGPMLVPYGGNISEDTSNNVFLNSSYKYIGTTNIYYLINFNNLWRSYGKTIYLLHYEKIDVS